MTFDPLFSSIIIAGLVVIGAVAIVPILRPLFSPITQLALHPQPEQKYLLRGILLLAVLGFIASAIFVVSMLTRKDTDVVPDPVETLPTTFPSETPIEQ